MSDTLDVFVLRDNVLYEDAREVVERLESVELLTRYQADALSQDINRFRQAGRPQCDALNDEIVKYMDATGYRAQRTVPVTDRLSELTSAYWAYYEASARERFLKRHFPVRKTEHLFSKVAGPLSAQDMHRIVCETVDCHALCAPWIIERQTLSMHEVEKAIVRQLFLFGQNEHVISLFRSRTTHLAQWQNAYPDAPWSEVFVGAMAVKRFLAANVGPINPESLNHALLRSDYLYPLRALFHFFSDVGRALPEERVSRIVAYLRGLETRTLVIVKDGVNTDPSIVTGVSLTGLQAGSQATRQASLWF